MNVQELPLFRLMVVADADPNALARVLEPFQNLNIQPRRVLAESSTDDVLHIEIDVVGLSDEKITLIAMRIERACSIVKIHWHRV